MDENIICPICHKDNLPDSQFCVCCGQRLKPIEISDMYLINNFNYQPPKTESKKPWILIVFITIFLIISFSFNINKQIISLVYKIFPQKIVSVNNITTTINQNDSFSLPKLVAAKMNYGRSRAVSISWDAEEINSTVPGTTTVDGKIDGYPSLIHCTVNVLPHEVKEFIDDCTVENSMVEYNADIYTDEKWAWFKITKGSEARDEVVPITNGVIKCKIYLPFNAGDYKVTLLTSTDEDQYSTYYEFEKYKVKNTDTRDMRFLMPDIDVESDSKEIINLANSITQDCFSDMEKTRAIHDWVATNIAYDTEAYFSNNLHNYTALQTMRDRKAVCSGYANLTAALNRAVGIKTKIIGGTATDNFNVTSTKNSSHAWNETYIDGRWVIQDTTWDAGGIDPKSHKFTFDLSHKYFDPAPNKFALDHTKTEEE